MHAKIESRLPLMFGLPDDHMVRFLSLANGGRIDIPGVASFLPHLAGEYAARLDPVFFGPRMSLTPSNMIGRPVINNTVDPDIASASLRILATMLKSTRSGCFNHPQAVLDTGRHRVAEKLSAIDGLEVPKTILVRIDEPSDIHAVMNANGLQFPVLLRVAGTHGGLALVRVDGRDELKTALRGIPWGVATSMSHNL